MVSGIFQGNQGASLHGDIFTGAGAHMDGGA